MNLRVFNVPTMYLFTVYYILFVPTNDHVCVKILNYVRNAATCFGTSAPSSGSFVIVFVKVIKY
jgi:hypothetical protein